MQHLLTPLLLDLAPAERLRLLELAPGLEEHGFSVNPLSGNTVALTSAPAVLTAGQAESLLPKKKWPLLPLQQRSKEIQLR